MKRNVVIIATLTAADVASMKMAAQAGVNYLDYWPSDDDEARDLNKGS